MKGEKEYRRFYTESAISIDTNTPVSTEFIHHYPDAAETAEELLASCREFRSIDRHARRFVAGRQNGHLSKESPSGIKQLMKSLLPQWGSQQNLPERDLRVVQQQLELFVQSGNLITQKELSKKIESSLSSLSGPAESPGDIEVLGIPTCNRGDLLVRCVKSYLNDSTNGSGTSSISHLHIVDDSNQPEPNNQTRQVIEELCQQNETSLSWIDKSYRTKFAEQLSQTADIPGNVIQFALFGDSRLKFTAGASRNTLLLLAAGSKSVQVDDDTKGEVRPAPTIQDGLALSTEEAQQFLFFPHKNAVSEFAEQHYTSCEHDFFSLHNTLLGTHPGILAESEDEIHDNQLSKAAFLETLQRQDAHIAVTFLGALGDSGMNHHWQRLTRKESSFQQLVEDESTYHDSICTRQLFRFVPHRTIGDTIYCMGMNMGLNTERLLPPFMPVLRNEDGTFGALLHRYFPNACKGYLPYAIRHDPPGRNSVPDKEKALQVGPLRTNDILVAVLLAMSEQNIEIGDKSTKNLITAGKYIKSLAEESGKAFQDEVRECCSKLISIRKKFIQQLLNERIDAPDYWKQDARQVIANFDSLLNSDNLCIPSDLSGNTRERLELFQDLMKRYGELLIYWKAIWSAAKSINNHG